MKFGIVTALYERPDGQTLPLFNRMISSVLVQTYQDFKVFVVGDDYKESFPNYGSKVVYENVKGISEREKYRGKNLWCCGGVNAQNYGLKKAISEGFDYLILLDYDDFWSGNHLKSFADLHDFAWACSLSTHLADDNFLPKDPASEMLPKPSGVIKSACCWKHSKIPLLLRNVFEETGKVRPSDSDFWERCRNFMLKKKLNGYCTRKVSCFHETTQYVVKGLK